VVSRVLSVICAVVVFACLTARCAAFEIERADAKFDQYEFRIDVRILLDAPIDKVEAVLRDYSHYPELEASILEAKVMQRSTASTLLLYTKLHACSGLFCRTVNRVERVEESERSLIATVLPEQSDITLGITHTELQEQGLQTRVTYRSRIVPKFWVPALIGRTLLLHTLRQASLDMFRNIETRAKL
jgi:hypothetical protein